MADVKQWHDCRQENLPHPSPWPDLTNRESKAYDAISGSSASFRRSIVMCRPFSISGRAIAIGAVILLAGCSKTKAPPANSAPSKPAILRLTIVDDPALAKQIARVKGEWKARSGVALELREQSVNDLRAAKSLGADAVIYPADELGTLAAQHLIRPLPAAWLNRAEFRRSDLFEPCGSAEAQWGDRTYAVPLGSPVFVLFYRRDLFDRFHVEPPQTWAAYQQAIDFFDKHRTGLPPKGSIAIEPLAPDWAGKMFLARAASYAKHRDYYSALFDKQTMKPLIASPPFVRALDELIAATKASAAASLRTTPADARRAILGGRCVMAISWPTAADSVAASAADSAAETKPDSAPKASGASAAPAVPSVGGSSPIRIGFCMLPGSAKAYNPKQRVWQTNPSDDGTGHADFSSAAGDALHRAPHPAQLTPLLSISGRLGSVTAESRSGELSFQLLVWLSGEEWGARICSASPATTLFRRSQLGKPQQWVEPSIAAPAAKQYAEVLARSLIRPQWLESPRIPGHAEYLSALDEAVRAAVAGKQSAADALSGAAKRWGQITARRGLDSQRAAYSRSLGLEP